VQKPAQKPAPKAPKFVPLFSREEPFTKGKH
jgi:hypothetical protein